MKLLFRQQARHTYEYVSQLWKTYFWTRPDNLWGLKVALSIAVLLLPTIFILGEPFWGTTLALGAVGAALSETDEHYRGRIKTLGVTVVSFFIVSISVELLHPYPWLFATGFALTIFSLILLGGINTRYQGVTFGALLVSIYAMLGVDIKPWYYQPVLLPLGGLLYGLVSTTLLYIRPFRLLQEQLALAYTYLAEYVRLKSELFPSTWEEQQQIRIELAQKNILIERGIDKIKETLTNYADELKAHGDSLEVLHPYYDKWLLLQQLHERTTASHQRYDILAQSVKKSSEELLVVEGFGRLLVEISKALRKYADTQLTGQRYEYPIGLKWTLASMQHLLKEHEDATEYAAMSLLLANLQKVGEMLNRVEEERLYIPVDSLITEKVSLWERLKTLCTPAHPRFRHAVRLVVCLVAGYGLTFCLPFAKSEWIVLTSLFVCQQSYTATRQRLFERILGTFVGVIVGVSLAYLLPTIEGEILLLLGSIFLFFKFVRNYYYISVMFVTIFVIAAFNIQTGMGTVLMLPRLLYTTIGAGLSFLVVRFIWTDWQYHHLPELVRVAVEKNKAYFDAVCSKEVSGAEYYQYRRAAHRADNAITTAWKGMFVEPRNKRILQKKAHRMTYLNHSLLSYISALGAHHYGKPMTAEEQAICQNISAVLSQSIVQISEGGCVADKRYSPENLRQWQAELWRAKTDGNDQLTVLLYNIAHISHELLKQTSDWQEGK